MILCWSKVTWNILRPISPKLMAKTFKASETISIMQVLDIAEDLIGTEAEDTEGDIEAGVIEEEAGEVEAGEAPIVVEAAGEEEVIIIKENTMRKKVRMKAKKKMETIISGTVMGMMAHPKTTTTLEMET